MLEFLTAWCDAMMTDGHSGHVDDRYAGMTKGMLSWGDCIAVSEHLDNARDLACSTRRWATPRRRAGSGP